MPVAEHKTLTITVTGRKQFPEAASFSHIVNETIAILHEIDADISKGITQPIIWRITHVSMNTPISLTILADKDVNQRNHGERVIRTCLNGLGVLNTKAQIPAHYSPRAVSGAKAIANALANGVASVEFSSPGKQTQAPTLRIVANVEAIYSKRPGAFYQVSSVEGKLELLSIHGGFAAHVFNQRTGAKVACTFEESLLAHALKCFGKRVSVYGRVRYTREGNPDHVEVKIIRALKELADLPQFADLEGIDITEGIDPTVFIRELRDAN